MTPEVLQKLEEAFAWDCTDAEACFYANISPATLYNYQNEHPEFLDRKKELKQSPVLKARETVIRAMRNDPELALKYLERKKKDEFAPKTETSTDINVKVLGYVHSGDLKQLPEQEQPKQLGEGQ